MLGAGDGLRFAWGTWYVWLYIYIYRWSITDGYPSLSRTCHGLSWNGAFLPNSWVIRCDFNEERVIINHQMFPVWETPWHSWGYVSKPSWAYVQVPSWIVSNLRKSNGHFFLGIHSQSYQWFKQIIVFSPFLLNRGICCCNQRWPDCLRRFSDRGNW